MEPRVKRHGPHPKPEAELRTRVVQLGLTAEEYDQIAAKAGSSTPRRVANFIRNSALGRGAAVPPKINYTTWLKLAQPLNNLNQIAKRLNQLGPFGEFDLKAVEQLRAEVVALRAELLK